jgi:hypothetical protein
LDDNNFESFPLCICLLKKLKTLRFSSNKLTLENLPASISQLTNLETLVSFLLLLPSPLSLNDFLPKAFDNNSIEAIPEVIWSLTSLQYLWMRSVISSPASLLTLLFL